MPSLNQVRTDHTGGLHHPEWLHALYLRYGASSATDEELHEGHHHEPGD